MYPFLLQGSSWSTWSDFSNCSINELDSNIWYQSRSRTCNITYTPLSLEDLGCEGPDIEELLCLPIDGQWSSWSELSNCTNIDSYWYKHRFRNCTEPMPEYGGQDCIGDSTESIQCEPVNGQWSEWKPSEEECTQNAEEHWTKPKHRTCSNPSPDFGGADCQPDPLTHETNLTYVVCPPGDNIYMIIELEFNILTVFQKMEDGLIGTSLMTLSVF